MGILELLLAGVLLGLPGSPGLPDEPAPPVPRILHTALDHTVPADGDTLAVSPSVVEIHFTGPIEEAGRSMVVTGPDGASLELTTLLPGEGALVLSGALPELTRGGYRVDWRVVAPDGHPLEGEFVFFVEGPTPTPAEGDSVVVPGRTTDSAGAPMELAAPPPQDDGPSERSWLSLLSAAATGFNVSLLAFAGLLAFAAWGPGAPGRTSLKSTLVLGLAVVVFAPLYAWLWVGQTLPGAAGFLGRLDGLLSLRAGQAIAAQVGLIWVAVWVFAVMQRVGVAAVLALLGVAVGAATGHALGTAPAVSIPANAVHLLAASAWMGGLLFLYAERRSPGHVEVVLGVSAVALVAAGTVAATGLLQSWILLDGLAALRDTIYGNLVVLKAVGLAVLVALGAYNRLALIPAVKESGDTAKLVRTVRIELVAGGAVFLVASVLAHTAP